jgi:hypothetical protein
MMTGRLQVLSPEQKAGGGSGEGLFQGGAMRWTGALRWTAARATIGPCLPYAAPRDAGAVRHDMFLDAHAIRHTGLLFFCGASIGRRNFELRSRPAMSHGRAKRSYCPSASSTTSLDRPVIRGRIPRLSGRLLWMASLLKLIRDFRSRLAASAIQPWMIGLQAKKSRG